MKNKKALLFGGILLLVFTIIIATVFGVKIYKNALIESGYGEGKNSPNQYAKDVTMLQLIATPEKYHGKLVRVIGIGNLEFENNGLYAEVTDLKYFTDNAVWLELGNRAITYKEAQQYNGQIVIVEGIFDKKDLGHLDAFQGSIKQISRYEPWLTYINARTTITQNADKTYSYEITDYSGRVIASEKALTRMPERRYVSTDVVGMSIQAGTGLMTNQTVYYDLKNSQISEVFTYVLAARDKYVVYADYKDGQHSITVQNIFNEGAYKKTHILRNVSPVAADFAVSGQFINENDIRITYYSGENYTTDEIVINIQ